MKIISALLLCFASASVSAASFDLVNLPRSNITFVSKQMGVVVTGKFAQFNSQISLDPAHPETGKAQIAVMLNSIDAGSDEANDEVKGKAWFNVQAYPNATFVASTVKALGGNQYQAVGKLTIKGKMRDVIVPFTAVVAGTSLLLDGNIPISRAAYGIGEGAWADTSVVADDVQVKFHFMLNSAK
jgi:polyisoprenoid-binding protein YceI